MFECLNKINTLPVPHSPFPINPSNETEHKLRSEDVLVVSAPPALARECSWKQLTS
jgi:hypothetical protein